MNELYPLKFKPVFLEKIWGGQRMKTVLGKNFAPLPNCGESWEISGVEGSVSEVRNGFLKGNPLNDLVEVYMGDLVGDQVFSKFGIEFPLLVKFLDSNDWLSVQIHPDDKTSMSHHHAYGKSEMWYVFHADEGAQVIHGFKKATSREDFMKKLSEKKLRDILQFVDVKTGDVFYNPAGLVHAVGPGICIAEIQQSSDITYRIYDWDRMDKDGNPREMHLDLALDVMDYGSDPEPSVPYIPVPGKTVTLVDTPFFTTNLLEAKQTMKRDYTFLDSFVIYLCFEGSVVIQFPGGEETLKKGETCLLPAVLKDITLQPKDSFKMLEAYISFQA
ncbi:MAG: type I phosphomannose isomerase catalytic subunit [Bacteroidota bacterium]